MQKDKGSRYIVIQKRENAKDSGTKQEWKRHDNNMKVPTFRAFCIHRGKERVPGGYY